jgi:2-hydroxychromene-2-carboxylate isomerase
VGEDPSPAPAAFYFDLASPLAYLAAEQVLHRLPGPAEWRGVLAAELPSAPGSPSPPSAAPDEEFRVAVAARAAELELQPLRWPDPFPFDSRLAMLIATYARSIGRAVPFAQAAFRQAFAGGRSLAEEDSVLIAAAACEMHPSAVLRAAGMRSVEQQLTETTAGAAAAGVKSVPAVRVGELLFHGEDALGAAADAMLRARVW